LQNTIGMEGHDETIKHLFFQYKFARSFFFREPAGDLRIIVLSLKRRKHHHRMATTPHATTTKPTPTTHSYKPNGKGQLAQPPANNSEETRHQASRPRHVQTNTNKTHLRLQGCPDQRTTTHVPEDRRADGRVQTSLRK
jgi:hypothetical protein